MRTLRDNRTTGKAKDGQRGNAVVEVALMLPWIMFVFILVFNFGFYAYAAMATENAARAAVLRTAVSPTASTDQALGCLFARREMRMIPNISPATTCDSLPLIVTVAADTDPDSNVTSRVEVTYQTPQMFPLPYMMGQMTLTRAAEVRIYR